MSGPLETPTLAAVAIVVGVLLVVAILFALTRSGRNR
jgi:hypothetical protein